MTLLVEHLEGRDAHLAAAPLAALTASLVRDLGEEMVPYFPQLFMALIRLLGRVGEMESLEVLLGSLFFFVKSLAPEIPPLDILGLLVESLQGPRLHARVQDFIAEFAIYIARRGFGPDLVQLLLHQLPQPDLCAAILAGGTVDAKGRSIAVPHLSVILEALGEHPMGDQLVEPLILALIDRTSPETAWSAIATALGHHLSHHPASISHVLAAIPAVAPMQGGRLLAQHRELLLAVISSCPDAAASLKDVRQNALATLLNFCELNVILGLREGLRGHLLDPRGIGLLCLLAPTKLELVVGTTAAAQVLASHIVQKVEERGHCLVLFDRLLSHVASGNHILSAQVASQFPVEGLLQVLQSSTTQTDYQLKYLALKVLSLMPSVGRLEWIEQIVQSPPDDMDVWWRLALLKLGMRFVPSPLMPALAESVEAASLEDPFALELLLACPNYIPPAGQLISSVLLSSDPQRRLLALQLLLRDGQLALGELPAECLALEQIPWTFNCDREKGLKLQVLANVLARSNSLVVGSGERMQVELAASYLVGLLLQGFAPLNRELYATLSVLVEKHSAVAQETFSRALQLLSHYPGPQSIDKGQGGKVTAAASTGQSTVTAWKFVDSVLAGEHLTYRQDDDAHNASPAEEPASPLFCESAVSNLLRLLASKPSLSEGIKTTLLPLVEAVLGPDSAGHDPCPSPSSCSLWLSRGLRNNLGDLLTALGGVRSIKKDGQSSGAWRLLERFLAHGDEGLQRRSLESILALGLYKGVGPFAERLRRLLNEKEMRDELVHLASEQQEVQQSEAWTNLWALLTPIIYGRLIARKGGNKAGRNALEIRRKLVLNYVATWASEHIHNFILFMAKQTGIMVTEGAMMGSPPVERVARFLQLLGTVLRKVGRNVSQATVDTVLQWLTCLGKHEEIGRNREVERLLMKRLLDVYLIVPGGVSIESWNGATWEMVRERVDRLELEYLQQRSALLDMLQVWVEEPRHLDLCLTVASPMWARLAAGLAVLSAQGIVVAQIIDMFLTFLRRLEEDQQPPATCAAIRAIVYSIIGPLCEALNGRIGAALASGRRERGGLLEKVVHLLMALATLFSAEVAADEAKAQALIASLLKLLMVKRGVDETVKAQILELLAQLHLPCMQDQTHSAACSLLDQLQERSSRSALASLFTRLARQDASLEFFANTLGELHAPSTTMIGAHDQDRQFLAFTALRNAAPSLAAAQWVPVLHAMFHFAHSAEDSVARRLAFTVIDSFVKKAKAEWEKKDEWAQLLLAHLYPAVKRGLGSKAEAVREEFLGLLNTLVVNFDIAPINTLRPLLADGDDELNILLNLLHLQQYRRSRALRHLAEFAKSPMGAGLTRPVIEQVLIPLLQPFIMVDPSTRDPNAVNLTQDAIAAMAALCGRLPSRAILGRAAKLVALMQKGVSYEKALLKLIPAIYGALPRDSLSQKHCRDSLDALSELLLSRSGELRPAIALSMAQLIVHLDDPDRRRSQASKLVCHLAKALVHKFDDRRQEARDALARVADVLGLEYLAGMLGELRVLLVGTQEHHILAFTFNHLLRRVGERPEVVLDEAVPHVLPVIVEDVFGVRAREKTAVEWTGKIAEVKAQKSPETLATLVASITPSVLMTTLQTIKQAIDKTRQSEAVTAVAKAIETGLIRRLSTTQVPAEIYALLYILLDGNSTFYSQSPGPYASLHQASIQLAACRATLHLLKRRQHELQQSGRSMPKEFLDKMLPLLLDSVLEAKSTPLIAGAIKCLPYLLSEMEGQSLEEQKLTRLLERLFSLVLTCDGGRDAELLGAAFKMITLLVRERDDVQLSEAQLRTLLEYARVNYESSESQSASIAHTLIRTILRRKVILPEVYQLMSTMSRTMLRSYVAPIRRQCRAAYMTFLLDYPFSKGKLEEHFVSMTANLGYEGDGGRESLVLFIGQLVGRLPLETLHEFGEMLLIALAARLVNEGNSAILKGVETAIGNIVKRMEARYLERLELLIERWLGASQSVNRIAWRFASLVVTAASVSVTGLTRRLLEGMTLASEGEAGDEEDPLVGDKGQALLAMMTRGDSFPAPLRAEILEKARGHIEKIVRNVKMVEACGELAGEYFAQLPGSSVGAAEHLSTYAEWGSTWIGQLCMLTTDRLAVSEQIVKNLVFIVRALLQSPKNAGLSPECADDKVTDEGGAIGLIRRLERAFQKQPARKSPLLASSTLKLFAALLLCLGQEPSSPAATPCQLSEELATPMVRVVLRVLEDRQRRGEEDARMAQQLSDLLSLQLGERYEELRIKLMRNRADGGHNNGLGLPTAGTDPMTVCKRRLKQTSRAPMPTKRPRSFRR